MRFDEVIEATLEATRARFAARPLDLTIVRDVAGQITAVIDDDALRDDEIEALAVTLDERLGRFSPGPARVLLRRSDLIDEQDVLESPDRVAIYSGVWVVDRLLSNHDWQRAPRHVPEIAVPIATAFSLKGGVGRSTALGVWAWHLARMGKRVVAIDLDLEAPGLASMLLGDLPDYGVVDWLVEGLIGAPDGDLLADSLAFSPVADGVEGTVQVLPAFGMKTRDYVAKLGRVYLPSLGPGGKELGLSERIGGLLQALANRGDRPDAILLDSRAGLHDLGAAAVTQLGAEVFLFARDEPQSWQTYRLLFEHLSRSQAVRFGMPEADLRWRLKMVAAQVDKTDGAIAKWRDASYRTWEALYDGEAPGGLPNGVDPEAQTFEIDEPNAPHYPLTVYFDMGFRGLDLVNPEKRPPWGAVEAAFGDFLESATERLIPSAGRTLAGQES